MAEATVDEGLQNLQNFCGLLANVNTRLTSLAEAFDAFATHVGALEDAAEERWNHLQEDLKALIHTADTGADEVVAEMTTLSEAAHDLSATRLSAAEHELERAENSLRDHLHEAVSALRQHLGSLEERGYNAAKTQVDASTSAIDHVEHAFDQHVTDASHGFETIQGHVTSAESELNHALSDADAAIDTAEGKIHAAAAKAAEGDDTVHQAAAQEEGQVNPHYDDLASHAATAAEALHELVSGLAQDTIQYLTGHLKTLVEESVQTGVVQPCEHWESALDALDDVFKEGETQTKELPRLVEDLEISKRKVVELEEAMSQMA
jgi:hypothetical protein